MRYRAVFFDAGETLVHPHPSFPELLGIVLREEGYPVDPAEVGAGVSVVSERFQRAAEDRELWTTSPEKSKRFWASVYEAFLVEIGVPGGPELHERLYREFTDLSNYRLFPDARPALERIAGAGLLLGVISNFEEWLERLLESLGIREFFQVRVVSGVEGIEKPDLEIFEVALDRAGVSATESVYVGDNPVFDTAPAEALGMLGVLIDRRGRFPEHPGTRVTTLEQLPAAMGLER